MIANYTYQGAIDPFYHINTTYPLTIHRKKFLWWERVYIEREATLRAFTESRRTYKNWGAFLEDWRRPKCGQCTNTSAGEYNGKPLCQPHIYAASFKFDNK